VHRSLEKRGAPKTLKPLAPTMERDGPSGLANTNTSAPRQGCFKAVEVARSAAPLSQRPFRICVDREHGLWQTPRTAPFRTTLSSRLLDLSLRSTLATDSLRCLRKLTRQRGGSSARSRAGRLRPVFSRATCCIRQSAQTCQIRPTR
jgi:hypothetical protein